MATASGPGCVLRASLVFFGLIFLPAAIWFAYKGLVQYWPQSLALLVVSVAFLRLGLSRKENSWIALLDDLSKNRRK